jgi:hypothetical protein
MAAIRHPRHDLVALGMHTMPSKQCADHVLTQSAISSRKAETLHAHVPHGDAIIDADSVELEGTPPAALYGYEPACQTPAGGRARDNVCGIDYRDKGLIHHGISDAGGF